MPAIPTSSPFITDIEASRLAGEIAPPDAIIVRGYLGSPVDVLIQANTILADNGLAGIPGASLTTVRSTPPTANVPWRIYLTARLDCWVEVPDWGADVLRVVAETSTDRTDAFTVWLRVRNAQEIPIRYRVVSIRVLDDEDGIVSGRLVEDYMSRAESSNVVWDEQAFGPTTGKKSSGNCF